MGRMNVKSDTFVFSREEAVLIMEALAVMADQESKKPDDDGRYNDLFLELHDMLE